MPTMSWVRALIYGFPVVIAGLYAASYLGSASLQKSPGRELLLGSGGEAKNLNPILSTTTADSRISGFIFNGLLTYDEHLELTGDLAESWDMSQTSTLAAVNETAAVELAAEIERLADRWEAWGIESVVADGAEVRVQFNQPGERAPGELLAALDTEKIKPMRVVRVALKGAARDSCEHFLAGAASAADVVRHWVGSSTGYELTVAGDARPLLEELTHYYEANPVAAAQIDAGGEEFRILNEPQIIFHLRDGVRWHDGEPFTSEDAVFTYQMIMNESVASPRRPDFELVARVEAPDPLTFVVTYRKPYSSALMSWGMGMLPKHVLAGKPTAWWAQNYNLSPIGTGPFRFAEWRSNEFVRLVRNDDYFEGRPWLEGIAVRTIPDQVAIRLAFLTRQIDIWSVDDHAVSRFRDDPRFELFASSNPAYEYIGWNLRRPLFQDVRVRTALAHAVDIGAIIKYIVYGYGRQSTGPFVPQTWYFSEAVQPLGFDPERARTLLAEAGWAPGPDGTLEKDGERFCFTLVCTQANETRKDIATLVQSDLRKIGIEVNIEMYEWTVFIRKVVQEQDFDAMVLGWSLGYDYDQYQLWHSSQGAPGMLNTGGYSNPEVDRLLEDLRTEFARDRIKEICAQLQSIIYRDQPYLFLYVPESIGAMWSGAYRVRRPDGRGGWIDEPVRATNAGFTHYMPWWYRSQDESEAETAGPPPEESAQPDGKPVPDIR